MEQSIYSLYKIDLKNLVQNKVALVKNFYIQPSEIDRMPFWEYELFFKEVNKYVKEENKRQEEENKKYDTSKYKPSNYKMPKMDGAGSFKMPSMPKF